MAYNSDDHAARNLLNAMRKAGVTLPKNPQRAQTASQSLMDGISSGSTIRSALQKYKSGDLKTVKTVEDARRMQRQASGNINIALEKRRDPLGSLREKGIPFNVNEEKELMEIRQWARIFRATHYLMPLCVEIYAQFPIQGMEISVKDPAIKAFYEQLFFDELEYETFLIDFGSEFYTVGEVNSLANFNESLGVWDNEEILNPDDIIVERSPFSKEHRYKLRIPETIRNIVENLDGNANPRDIQIIHQYYPEFLAMARSWDDNDGLDISNILLSRTVNKSTAWDVRGTPHMLRCFRQLIMEEALNAAQDAIADRLYSPLILAKLGSPDLGDGEGWIPDVDELDAFRDDMQMALAADFRFLAYHFGLDIENVFGREAMPRFDQDYERLERKMLQVWGIGDALISGSNSGTYASSALNAEFVTQMMSSYQKYIQKHFRKRCEVVAEAQEHFDYEISGGMRVPIYEEVFEWDDEAQEGRIVKKPKLLIPEINFQSVNLRDEAIERQFLTQLKTMGVPISDQALMVNIPFEFNDEVEKLAEERAAKVLAEARANVKIINALEAEGLPLDSSMQAIKQAIDIQQIEAINGQDVPAEQVPPAMPDQNITNAPIPAPNIAPDMTNIVPQPGVSPQGFGDEVLPRNQIAQRPEISDQMRQNAPHRSNTDGEVKRVSRYTTGPSIANVRGKLKPESVEDAVVNRPWSEYLPVGAKRRLAKVANSEINEKTN